MQYPWKVAILVTCAVAMQTFASAVPAAAGIGREVRREEAKVAHSRAEARADSREGHHLRAMLHSHRAARQERRVQRLRQYN